VTAALFDSHHEWQVVVWISGLLKYGIEADGVLG